jgi:hypothetical protein
MFGPEAPPKAKMYGPEKPPKAKTFGPEEAPPVGYGSSERTPKAPNRSDAPPRDEYAEKMLRLRKQAAEDAYTPAKQREKDYQDLKGLKGMGVPGARGLPAAAATAFSMATDAYMEPAVQREADRVIRQYGTAGNLVGMGGIGAQSVSSSRLTDRGALAAAGVDAGLTIAQALLAARAGRTKEAAGMFALGLADMVGPTAAPGPPSRRGTGAHFDQQTRLMGVLGFDAGVTVLQEKLQNYAAETGNKQFSQELKALAADPERLKETIKK